MRSKPQQRKMSLSLFHTIFFLIALFFATYLPVFTSAYSSQPDPQVQQLQQLIASKQYSGAQLGLIHLQLAISLQQQWYSKQVGGVALADALQSFNAALQIFERLDVRKTVEIYYHRGILLKLMGRGEESFSSFQHALQYELHRYDQASILFYRADTLLMLGRLQEAIRSYRRSMAKAPCKTERYYGYVMALKEDNQLVETEWKSILQTLLDVEAYCHDGNHSIAWLAQQHLEVEEYLPSYLFDADEAEGNKSSKESDLYYAIYQVADKLKQPALAWQYLTKGHGKEQVRRGHNFDVAGTIHMKNTTTAIFNQQLLHSFPDMSKKASKVPIFVIGMMRSGSTLMETMLDAHPAIWGMGEDSVFNANLTALRDNMVSASSGDDQQQMEQVLLDFGRSTVKNMKKMVLQNMDQKKHKQNSTSAVSVHGKDAKKMKHIVDKMLFNYRNIGFIHAVFPQAVIIHMIRDPLDTLLSCFKQKFDDVGLEWTLNVKTLVLQFVLYLEYVHHFRGLLPQRVVDVRYEALVEDPESILRNIIEDRLDLPWDAKVLDFHRSQRIVQTNSQSQVRQKLYKHSMGSWRKYADQVQEIIAEFHRYLPYLKKKKMLPFPRDINWEMRVDFPYEASSDGKEL